MRRANFINDDDDLVSNVTNATLALDSDALLCHIFYVQTRMDGFPDIVDEDNYECFPWTGDGDSLESYFIDLPSDFIIDFQAELASGQSYVIIPNGTIVDRQVVIPENGTVSMFSDRALQELGIEEPPYQSRRLSALQYRSVLIVSVKTPDSNVTISNTALSKHFFTDTATSLRSQYYACSHGKIVMVPAADRHAIGLVGGVVQISLKTHAIGTNRSVVKNAATVAATKLLGVNSLGDLYDHVAYCLPPGTAGDWLSYGFISYFETVYNNQWCTYVSSQLHEFGHNFGHLHSHESFQPYADRTCSMGYSYPVIAWPTMCFNANKFWKFGWFSDAATTIDPAVGGLVKIIATADYDLRATDQYVVVQVLNPGTGPTSPEGLPGLDFYLMWNLPKGENIDVLSHQNKTTIVQEYSAYSNLVAALDFTNSYTIPYTYPNGDKVVIKLCEYVVVPGSAPDYLTLSVARNGDNCKASAVCVDASFQFTFSNSLVSCAWLSIRPTYWTAACKNATVASKCQQTCKKC